MDVMSSLKFLLLHLTGQPATPDQVFFLDGMLDGREKHRMVPCGQAARMTLARAPEMLQGAVAAGINGVGSVILSAAENAGKLLIRVVTEMNKNIETGEVTASRIALEPRKSGPSGPKLVLLHSRVSTYVALLQSR